MTENKKLYLTKAIHHYNKLFTLPTHSTLLFLILIISLGGSIIAFTISHRTLDGMIRGVIFAFQVLFIPLMGVDILSKVTITKTDTILNFKRSISLSLVICIIWIIIINVASVLHSFFQLPKILVSATFFSICITVALRFLVLSTVTQLSLSRLTLTTLAQPAVLFVSNVIFWNNWSLQIIVASTVSVAILLIAAKLFIYIVDKQGEAIVGIHTIRLFKGFLANWLENSTELLEEYFEKLGINANVSVNLFVFRVKSKLKAILVIPNIHPGPFRNLGSSDLPGMIQRSVENKFSIIVAVPHGLSGHELDLTSQSQCSKVIKEILNTDFSVFSAQASKSVRVDTGLAKAVCQFFGDVALVATTCAPKSMEDIPLNVGEEIIKRGNQLGAKEVTIIDAHNSIGMVNEDASLSEEEERELILAAEKVIKDTMDEARQPFFVGIAKIVPKEFTIDQGIGLGGIVALTVICDGQKTLYVTIDGNNMISGLREEIIQALSTSFDECEVLTTDTHTVNAVNTIRRGYYPVGEAIDRKRLISYVKSTAEKAIDNAEKAEVSFTKISINNVKVIGGEKLVNLSMLIDLTFSVMKRSAPLIFIPAVCVVLLMFLLI